MKKAYLFLAAIVALQLFSCNGKSNEKEAVIDPPVIEVEEIEVLEPVKWTSNIEKLGENEYKLSFTSTIDEGWNVYSTTIEGDGPIPTTINLDDNEAVVESKDVEESGEEVHEGYDTMFDMDIKKFSKGATFSKVVKTNGATTLTGYLEYMTCDSMQCLFPDPVEFSFDVE